ncbi:GTP cyclohydrolase II [Stigmatella aurantiaca]|uniref:GTP cyclohydrolase II n=1 Tax=Stigmatella aurantiaca TaxID=41 RepID=A0A1H7W4A8_STIAU|nr:GTP cyclohydrolase II [Stigmatella aurantiaca]SEM16422.1 GTP cyclohydrolase II [Stigmatella aurantiaca]
MIALVQPQRAPEDIASVRQKVSIPVLDGYVNGTFYSFHGLPDGKEHFLVELGPKGTGKDPLVRLHSECMTGDVFGSQKCDCGPQLRESLFRINSEGGYLLYLRQEGRGIGLYSKFDAYKLQSEGLDTYDANRRLSFEDDLRDYSSAASMLRALDATRIRLLSNNPDKAAQLAAHGITITEQVQTGTYMTAHNQRYLQAKALRTNHKINLG